VGRRTGHRRPRPVRSGRRRRTRTCWRSSTGSSASDPTPAPTPEPSGAARRPLRVTEHPGPAPWSPSVWPVRPVWSGHSRRKANRTWPKNAHVFD
jgi:hypothetical protein